MNRVPRADLSVFDRADAAGRRASVEIVGDGLREFGFLTIEGHGVDPSLIEAASSEFARFFARTAEDKARSSGVRGGARGYTPMGCETAVGGVQPDLKEFFHVGQELAPGHALAEIYPPNVWPEGADALRVAAVALFAELERCACRVLEALAAYFELAPDTFSSMMRDGNHVLRALHYPPPSEDSHPDALRAAPHEDINLVTLLTGSTAEGLEILTREGDWVPVSAAPGEIIVDAGDMLARVTNDVVPATTHRVVNPPRSAGPRYAIPFFAHPYPSCDLSVLPPFVSEETPARYPPTTAGEFLDRRLREIGLL